jgi:DNA-directed RNA polymerase subunit RPC12/RpoP
MRRVHRTLMERVNYLAIYACKECNTEDNLPRSHQLHRGKAARCPKCGTYRLTRLKEPDHIDPMHTGVWNLLEKLAGGKLFHCRFCRIQFWDRRRLRVEVQADEAASPEEANATPEAETATQNPNGDSA